MGTTDRSENLKLWNNSGVFEFSTQYCSAYHKLKRYNMQLKKNKQCYFIDIIFHFNLVFLFVILFYKLCNKKMYC